MQYSLAYKVKAIQLSDRIGISATVEKLEITSGRLYEWRRNRAYLMARYEKQIQSEEQNRDEVAALLNELSALKQNQ